MRQPACQLPLLVLVLVPGLAYVSCASGVGGSPFERTELWHRYRELADVRALAIAGDPAGVWVAGVAAGLASAEEAQHEALTECERRRAARRLQAPCGIYATGSEVTWQGSPSGRRSEH